MKGLFKNSLLMFFRRTKWNESGFRPPLCTYRLNWARRTSWGWWDDWDDTVLQTQDSKFEPWRSEAEHATSRSRRLPTILTFTRGWGRNNFVSFKPPRPGTEPRTLAWKAAVLTTTLGPPPFRRTMDDNSIPGLLWFDVNYMALWTLSRWEIHDSLLGKYLMASKLAIVSREYRKPRVLQSDKISISCGFVTGDWCCKTSLAVMNKYIYHVKPTYKSKPTS